MVKTEWGWDRQSFPPDPVIADIIRKVAGGIMGRDMPAGGDLPDQCSYPVFQVIDGDGNPTEYFDAYLAWANTQSDCSPSSFECAPNKGRGTIMTPGLVE